MSSSANGDYSGSVGYSTREPAYLGGTPDESLHIRIALAVTFLVIAAILYVVLVICAPYMAIAGAVVLEVFFWIFCLTSIGLSVSVIIEKCTG